MFILAWLDEWPLTDFWHKKFSSDSETFLWARWDGEKNGKKYYVGLDMRQDLAYTPLVMVERSVHNKITKEIYKIEENWENVYL